MSRPVRRRASEIIVQAMLIIALIFVVEAQADVDFTASVSDKSVPLNGELTYTLRISGDAGSVPQPELPPMTGFAVVSTSRNQSFEFVNGRTSSSIEYVYNLAPRQKGSFTIGSASIVVDGRTYHTDPIVVQVTNPQSAPSPRQDIQQGRPGQTARSQDEPRLHLEIDLEKDTAFVNEPVLYTVRVLIGQRLLSNPDYQAPEFPGFWKEDLERRQPSQVTVNGIPYTVHEIRSVLFPTSAGVDTLQSGTLVANVPDRSRTRTRDPFNIFGDDWFSAFDRGRTVRIQDDPVTLTVVPLPQEGRPANFSGAVGDFQLAAVPDRTEVNVGDPVTVTVTVSGVGQIRSLSEPTFTVPEGLRQFSAGSSEQQNNRGSRVGGIKTFDEVFIPQRPGSYQIPAFTFTYFDPKRHVYNTLQTDPINITASGQAADMTIPSLQLNRDELADLASDVRFLKTDSTDLHRRESGSVSNTLFVVSHVLALLAFGALIGLRKYRDRLEDDPVYARRRRAARTALDLLAAAEKGSADVAPTVATALARYFGDRFNQPAAGQTPDQMHAILTRGKIDPKLIDGFVETLRTCDRLRFMPGGVQAEKSLIDSARDIIEKLEKSSR